MVRCADPSGCDEKKKPVDSRACSSDRKCATQSFKWFTGPWSPCSDPCAINGKMSREVVCLVYNRGQHRIGSGCPARERPDPERPCPPNLLRADCQPQWFVGDWSQVSIMLFVFSRNSYYSSNLTYLNKRIILFAVLGDLRQYAAGPPSYLPGLFRCPRGHMSGTAPRH